MTVVACSAAFQIGTAEANHGGGGGGGHSGGGGSHGGGGGGHSSGGFHGGGRGFSTGGYRGYGGYGGARIGFRAGGVRGYSAYRGGYRGYGGWGVRGHVGWGYGYYNPYYYGYGYGYPYAGDGVPSYYPAQGYYPVAPSTTAMVGPVYVPPPPLPRFGIGVAAGAVDVDHNSDSRDLAFLARVRITDGLLVEGEVGETSFQNDLRVDRRYGASLIYEIGARNRLAPYVVGGFGIDQDNIGGSYTTDQTFAEIGAGLRFAITPHFHIAADVRAGTRTAADDSNQPDLTGEARTVAPSTSGNDNYTRGRLSAILYF